MTIFSLECLKMVIFDDEEFLAIASQSKIFKQKYLMLKRIESFTQFFQLINYTIRNWLNFLETSFKRSKILMVKYSRIYSIRHFFSKAIKYLQFGPFFFLTDEGTTPISLSHFIDKSKFLTLTFMLFIDVELIFSINCGIPRNKCLN